MRMFTIKLGLTGTQGILKTQPRGRVPWVWSWCSPLEQQVQHLLGGGEGSVGAQEDGNVGEVTALKGRHQVLHQLLQSASLHCAHLAGLVEVQG